MGKFEIEVEGAPEHVWRALTSQEALRDWFNATIELEPREGGHVCFEGTRGDQAFRYEGEVTSLTPQEQIRFDLRDSDGNSATLAISIRPGEDFTTVELQHDGFDEKSGDDGQFWNGDELIALRDFVTGIGPTH